MVPRTVCDEKWFLIHYVMQMGIATVRGCEIEGLLDDKGHLIEEQDDYKFKTDERTLRVWLDCNQYHADMVC